VRFRTIPSAGVPVSFSQIIKIITRYVRMRENYESFEESFSKYIGLPYCFATWSGRSAIYLSLLAFKELKPEKSDVLISVWTCGAVYKAVKKAGLNPVLYDIDPENLGSSVISIREKINSDTLCVITSTLFGISVNMDEICDLLKDKQAFIMEDSAQSLGAEWGGKKIGSFGDISIFSFGKSKNITTVWGGMVCTGSEEIQSKVSKIYSSWSKPSIIRSTKIFIVLLVNFIVIKPFFFNLFRSIIRLLFEDPHFTTQFPVLKMGTFQKVIGCIMLENVEKLITKRRENTFLIKKHMKNMHNVSFLGDVKEGRNVYLRLPIIVDKEVTKDKLISEYIKRGIWARTSLIKPLWSYTGCDSKLYPITKKMNSKIIFLPTHPYLKKRDLMKYVIE
jgi:dTDP-4-amino-4,6-dideoxygalactose transaminase|tara:strand:+ start:461 stop:1633 length:1173 start_codon:yes stop_codon:yes gene_type:complete